MSKLVLERKGQADETGVLGDEGGPRVVFTPPIDEDYWTYRVVLSEKQAVVGFPKFGTIGVGFAVEEDWNTNLPYTCPTEQIASHIAHNKGDDSIHDTDVLQAIRLIQAAVAEDGGPPR